MKFTVERAALMKTLSHLTRVVERKNTIPILANVLLSASSDGLRLRATDLDIEVSDLAPAVVDDAGETTVPAYLFSDIVRKMPDGCQIAVEMADSLITMKAGRSRFKLQTLPASDFPDLSIGTDEEPTIFEVTPAEIGVLFGKTQFAISTEATRYYLNGVYLHLDKDKRLAAVATDGHRLAKHSIACPEGASKIKGIIVPRKTVAEVIKLREEAETIGIEIRSTKITFTVGNVVLRSKLIDGQFPDYIRVIPTGNNNVALVDRAAMASCVDRVSVLTSGSGRAVKMSWSAGKLEASVTSPDHGSAVEEIEAEYFSDKLEIGFNSRYIADMMKEIGGDKVRVELGDPGSPTLFKPEGDNSALYVLMPMRV